MPRRRPVNVTLIVLVPVLLVAGIWLGGHPDFLPGPVRSALVGDSDGRLYQEAINTIEDNYYRKVSPDQLVNKSLTAAVSSLDDRFSHYFDPKAYAAFQEATEGA